MFLDVLNKLSSVVLSKKLNISMHLTVTTITSNNNSLRRLQTVE